MIASIVVWGSFLPGSSFQFLADADASFSRVTPIRLMTCRGRQHDRSLQVEFVSYPGESTVKAIAKEMGPEGKQTMSNWDAQDAPVSFSSYKDKNSQCTLVVKFAGKKESIKLEIVNDRDYDHIQFEKHPESIRNLMCLTMRNLKDYLSVASGEKKETPFVCNPIQ